MPTNFPEFSAKLKEFSRSIPRDLLPDFQRRVAIRFLQGVVLRTPVDTGRARANWNAAIGTPSNDLGGPTGASEVVSRANKVLKDIAPFQIVYITNNVVYIKFLDRGSSRQAPNGMVAVTLAEIQQEFAT